MLVLLQMWLQRGSNVENFHCPTWENTYNAMIAIELIVAAHRFKQALASTHNKKLCS